ncbi:MAG: hypothetical protein DMF94_05900 [Acidobacteria bacterium]|nr:MAG: hypothetical protein DMF94_05900 [Acidobacteriota bacterium]
MVSSSLRSCRVPMCSPLAYPIPVRRRRMRARLFVAGLLVVCSAGSLPAQRGGGAGPQNPFLGNAQAISEGENLYNQRCTTCHGAGGGGGETGPAIVSGDRMHRHLEGRHIHPRASRHGDRQPASRRRRARRGGVLGQRAMRHLPHAVRQGRTDGTRPLEYCGCSKGQLDRRRADETTASCLWQRRRASADAARHGLLSAGLRHNDRRQDFRWRAPERGWLFAPDDRQRSAAPPVRQGEIAQSCRRD